MKVKERNAQGVDWVSPDTPITEIAKLMRAHDIGCIPIGEDDRLVGMVTDRDIVAKGLRATVSDASRAKARDVMTDGIHCCREDDDLAKAVASHGDAEGPQVAGNQQEQADGRHDQPGRRQPFHIR
jgi:CBS domain-containing protein